MTDRMNAVVARTKDEKTYYTNIGVAFPMKGGGYSIVLSALPIPDDKGDVRILLFPVKDEKDDRRGNDRGRTRDRDDDRRQERRDTRRDDDRSDRGRDDDRRQRRDAGRDDDDDIPF